MKRYGEKFELTQELMDAIAGYMDDDIREDLHVKFATVQARRVFNRIFGA